MAQPLRPRLQLEFLETRDVPDGSLGTEDFNSLIPPSLPASWGVHVADSSAFATASGNGVDGSIALVSNGTSRSNGLTWYGSSVSGNAGAAVSIKASTLIPAFVFARGSNLDSNAPSYLAAVVTRGLTVELRQVTNGVSTVLGSVSSPPSFYLSGKWVRVSLMPIGDSVSVQVVRADTGEYLNASGTWQANPVMAVTATTTIPAATGYAGVGRAAQYAGAVALDDFDILGNAPSVSQSFDTTATGATPTGWQTWLGGAPGTLGATSARALSPTNGFASTGGSATAARAWFATEMPADVDASVAIYADSLLPARILVRGSNLDAAAPTYYAANLTRGLNVSLVRVVNGVETSLSSLQSNQYVSGKWIRLRLIAEGDRLRVTVFRTDTQQWLTLAGNWSEVLNFALEKHDSGIAGPGMVGIARKAAYSGTLIFDDFEAHSADATSGPAVSVAPLSGSSPFSGDVTFRATAAATATRIEFELDGVLQTVSSTNPATWALNTTTLANGTHTLSVRAFDAAGNFGSAECPFSTNNQGQGSIFSPTIPRHYSHIRIAQLAYTGNPMGVFEQNLLASSVDVVIPNPNFLSTIQTVAPDTPQLIYSNVSNLYEGLLTDWLSYADAHGISRELAFYHVTKSTPFTGSSPSSQPVTWFWGAYQTVNGTTSDVTSAARGGRNVNVSFGAAGTTTAIGQIEKFREMNVTLVSGATGSWGGGWEYASAVNASGTPTAWRSLALRSDGTNGLRSSGTISFDPPTDWVATSPGGSGRLFYVRFRVTSGTTAQDPELRTVFGRDYVGANGGTSGTIPAFDYAADANGDGYLNDTEYATRQNGFNARFVYETRLFYPYYGQMRFVTNPSDLNVQNWAADYHERLLEATPLADGVFVDNATGKIPFPGVSVYEPTAKYSEDSGALMAAISHAIEPRWVMANTVGGGLDAQPIAAGSAATIEEFLLRPLQANWSEVGDAANLINARLDPDGSSYLVIDTHPGGGSPTDSRTQLAALAYYYLVADPDRTFLMFFGGYSPSSSWTQHWSPAAAVDVGAPTGAMRIFATGADPSSPARTYKVFARDYQNALVLYKPLSYSLGVGEGTTANNTVTTHQLGGTYRQVYANGTLGPVVSAVSLRNGEGTVFIRA